MTSRWLIFILLFFSIPSIAFTQVQSKNVELIGQIQLQGMPSDVVVDGKNAYIQTGNDLSIVDVSDPKNPVELSQVKIRDLDPARMWDFFVSEKYAYVANQSGIRVIDVSDPKKPVEADFYPCNPYGVFVLGKYAYVSDKEGLIVLDVSDPKNVRKRGVCAVPDVMIPPAKPYAVENYVYMLNGNAAFYVVDVTHSANPEFVAKIPIENFPWSMYVAGNYAYIVDIMRGLYIIDISDPENPKEASSREMDGAMDICVAGNYAYIVDIGTDKGLRVLDISNPDNLTEVGFYDPHSQMRGVDVSGVYAYVTVFGNTLSILKYDKATPPKISVDPKGKLIDQWGRIKEQR